MDLLPWENEFLIIIIQLKCILCERWNEDVENDTVQIMHFYRNECGSCHTNSFS